MSIIAFIPARGGSKSIPLKNIRKLCGKPLIYWTLKALSNANVDKIVVATDNNSIKEVVLNFNFSKVVVYDRKPDNAKDDSTTESVMLEYIEQSNLQNSDTFILVQATSPFTRTSDFNNGLELFKSYDSVVTCSLSKKFIWNRKGFAINYDVSNRPRRQNNQGDFLENGAFYINTVQNIKCTGNRISGNIGIYEMPEYSSLEIDEPFDLLMAELIMKKFIFTNVLDFPKIKIFLSDVDGVLTDAGMYYTENGDEIKKFSTYDGMGMKILQESGVKVGILTSESRKINKRRAQKLNLDYDFHGAVNKLQIVEDLCKDEGITIDQVMYIGDDINCFELLSAVGVAACPSNAITKIKSIPNIIQLNSRGGDGAVRELIDLYLS